MRRADRNCFEAWVREALDAVPCELATRVKNLEVVVEEWPSKEELRSVGLPANATLFGLYQGIPLPKRGTETAGLPDRIVLYRGPISERCTSAEEIREEVRRTVLHELGHYFGFDEATLEALGWD
ncbi:MAG: metallopeptidase family protein [Candidatus Methylomirabilales bacterium]